MLLGAGREVVSMTSAYNITKLSYRVEVRVNNNELLDAIIFSVCLHISQPGNVFEKITHR